METECQTVSEEKLREEIESWKETCEVVGNKEIMESIQNSLRQIANGEGMPLSEL